MHLLKAINWDKIWRGLRKILGYEIPKSDKVLYLGNLTQDIIRKEDEYLVKVLLLASKKAITRLWYKAEPPTWSSGGALWKKYL